MRQTDHPDRPPETLRAKQDHGIGIDSEGKFCLVGEDDEDDQDAERRARRLGWPS